MSSPEWVEPLWDQFFDRLAAIPDPIPDNWRSDPVINTACEFADLQALEVEMRFLAGRYASFDELIGTNVPTSIHHLYHLARWEESTGRTVADLESVVEWGGGYGSMARLVRRLNPTCRYTILDHAPMLRFARHFLGRHNIEDVTLLDVSGPTFVLPETPDLFISTWALSESATPAQDFVFGCNLFSAKSVLLGFNTSAAFYGSSSFAAHVDRIEGVRESAADGQSEYLFR